MPTVLLVEDDDSIRELTEAALVAAGLEVEAAATGADGWLRYRSHRPDLAILDLMLPEVDGLELCRRIRQESTIPILVLTARSETLDVVRGLEAGADDYLTKPFEMPELVARVRAGLRRVTRHSGSEPLRLGDLVIDVDGFQVSRQDEEISLTSTELRLLACLASHPGRVLTREILLEQVWGYDHLGDSRLVDMAIQRLRAKVEPDPRHPTLIQTVRGVGYRAAS